jgi:hypothetical protein
MSIESLRGNAATKMREQIGSHTELLATSTNAPLEQMRAWQGIITGLKLAMQILDDEYQATR